MSSGGAGPFAGLPAEVVEVLAGAPVQEKVLAEFEVAWPGLSEGRARMAEVLRLFVVTWDPLEHPVPRPAAFATVNAGAPGLEVVVYIPVWVLAAAVGRGRGQSTWWASWRARRWWRRPMSRRW